MAEWQLFEPGTIPAYTTPEWYAERERAPHLEQSAHQGRLRLAVEMIVDAYPLDVVDLGAGDGGLLSLLALRYFNSLNSLAGVGPPAWGYDLQPTNIAGALERGADVRLGDVVHGDIAWGEAAVATEMLEHLVDPHTFVQRIAEHSRILVASSPWTETGEQHYEFHTWAWDMDGYRALLEQAGYTIRRHEKADMFQVIMGVL